MGFGKDGKGVILHDVAQVAVGALADAASIKMTTPYVIEDDFRVIKIEWAGRMSGHTAGEGPLVLVFADNELLVAEIAQVLVASPVDSNDNVNNERANRPVFNMAMVSGNATTDILTQHGGTFHEKTIRWTFSNPEGFTWAIVNHSGGALTSGTVIDLQCKYYGVWVR